MAEPDPVFVRRVVLSNYKSIKECSVSLGPLVFLVGPNGAAFVGIEEPEVAVHPGAAGLLRDALRAASRTVQVAVTSHSPDLLDDKDVTPDMILPVVSRHGETRIGPLDSAGREAIRERLYTAGELLRLDQIDLDEDAVAGVTPEQLELFALSAAPGRPRARRGSGPRSRLAPCAP